MMALDNHQFLFPHQPSSDWDPNAFGVRDEYFHEQQQQQQQQQQQHSTLGGAIMESPVSSEASTGYLQDAVAEWSERSKRRRLTSSPVLDSTLSDLQDLLQGFWDSDCHGDPLDSLNCMLQDNFIFSDDPFDLLSKAKQQVIISSTIAEEIQQELLSSSSSFHDQEPPYSYNGTNNRKDSQQSKDSKSSVLTSTVKALNFNKECESREYKKNKKKKAMGVVYPFAVVKPGGFDGDVTLDDINTRILMPPSRPVRHPVGEYACLPCVYPDGLGLSGKAVVSLTRIHTHGSGTITIIRTKG